MKYEKAPDEGSIGNSDAAIGRDDVFFTDEGDYAFQPRTARDGEVADRLLDIHAGFSPDTIGRPEDEPSTRPADNGDRSDTDGAMDIRLNWLDTEPPAEEDWDDSDPGTDGRQQESQGSRLPLVLVSVALVALVLVAVGGLGILQERSALQEQVRQLQASLATAVQPEEAAELRRQRDRVQQDYQALDAGMSELALENRRLEDTVAGLQQQLEELQAASPAPAAKPEASPPTSTPRADPVQTLAAGNQPGWFINFSSYGQRSAAERWAARIQPSSGTVAITEAAVGNRTIYRVRIVGLASKELAQGVAGQLQRDFDLPEVWIGRQ